MATPKAERDASLRAIGFRATPELRRKLEEAASQNGRSLSAELESRLETSFAQSDLIERLSAKVKINAQVELAYREELTKERARIAELEARLADRADVAAGLEQLRSNMTTDVEGAVERAVKRLVRLRPVSP